MQKVNNTQRIIIATYTTLTVMILLFTTLFELEAPAQYLRFGTRVAMLLTIVVIQKNYREQKILVFAFICTLVSDYFFILLRATDPDFVNRELYGMLGFVLAYVFLIMAFQRKFKVGKRELFVFVPFACIFILVFIALMEYAVGFMFWAAIILGIVLCYTGTVMASSLFLGYFSNSVALRIALAGSILFLSDMLVAFSIFHPDFQGFVLWKENAIWVTYMIGWTMILSVAAEEHLLAEKN